MRSFGDSKPIGVHLWAGSVSTYGAVNPSFRMFEVDAETMLITKAHTYVFNISDENPQWRYDHELSERYNMTDLSPQSFDLLSDRIL